MIDAVGLGLSLAGAGLLACRVRASAWGWVLFLLSNVAWASYALLHGPVTLAVQHAAFMATSLVGIWRYRADLYHSLHSPQSAGQGPNAPPRRRP